jgi:hypothetical protein
VLARLAWQSREDDVVRKRNMNSEDSPWVLTKQRQGIDVTEFREELTSRDLLVWLECLNSSHIVAHHFYYAPC